MNTGGCGAVAPDVRVLGENGVVASHFWMSVSILVLGQTA